MATLDDMLEEERRKKRGAAVVSLDDALREMRGKPAAAPPEPVAAEPDIRGKDSYVYKFEKPSQRKFVRSTMKETRNTARKLRRTPRGAELLEEERERDEPGLFSTMTKPVLDMLTLGEVSAPFVHEMLQSGDKAKAFSRAVNELGDKLPGLDVEAGKEHTVWTDVIKLTEDLTGRGLGHAARSLVDPVTMSKNLISLAGVGDEKAFKKTTTQQFDTLAPLALGFVLDVFTDPITYAGGLIPSGIVKGGRALKSGLKAIPGVSREVARAKKTLEPAFEAMMRGIDLLPEGHQWFTRYGKLKEMARRHAKEPPTEGLPPVTQEGIDFFRQRVDEAETLKEVGVDEMYRAIEKKFEGASQQERDIIGLFLDQSKVVNREIRALSETPEEVKALDGIVEFLREFYTKRYKQETGAKIMDEGTFAAHYSPGIAPVTAASEKRLLGYQESIGVEPLGKRLTGAMAQGRRLIGQGEVAQSHRAVYPNMQAAVLAGERRELDAALMAMRRGEVGVTESINRLLIQSVIDNPAISRKIEDPSLLRNNAFTTQILEQGYDIWRPFRKGEHAFVMPAPIVKDLERMQKGFEDPGTFMEWVGLFRALQNLWKGYAVLSPGFHNRNMQSNIFNNAVAGVTDPAYYGDALKLQRGEGGVSKTLGADWDLPNTELLTENVRLLGEATEDGRLLLKKGTELADKDLRSVLKVMGIETSGLFSRDMATSMEGKLLSALSKKRKHKGLSTGVPEKLEEGMFASAKDAKGTLTDELRSLQAEREAILGTLTPARKLEREVGKQGRPSLADELDDMGGANFEVSGIAGEFRGLPNHYYMQGVLSKQGGTSTDKVVDHLAKYRPELGIQTESDLAKALQEGGDRVFAKYSEHDLDILRREDELAKRMGGVGDELGLHQTEDLEGELLLVNDQIGDLKRSIDEADVPIQQGMAEALLEAEPKAMQGFIRRTFGQEGTVMNLNRWYGKQVENNARMGHALYQIDQGLSASEVREKIITYNFDYGNLTPTEKEVFKTVMPFYAWMRFNVPLQVKSLLSNPVRYARVPKAFNALEASSPEYDNITLPDYFQELDARRTPFRTAEDKPVYWNPNLPYQDLNRVNWRDIAGGFTPLLRVPVETMMGAEGRGFSIFLGREHERYPGEGSRVLPFVSRKWEAAAEGLIPPLGKAFRMIHRAKQGDIWPQLSTELGGVKLTTVHPERTKMTKERKLRDAGRRAVKRQKEEALKQ